MVRGAPRRVARQCAGDEKVPHPYWHVWDGHSTNPRADMRMVWTLTLTAISAILPVRGMFLRARQLALG